jgi:hypothetical protein
VGELRHADDHEQRRQCTRGTPALDRWLGEINSRPAVQRGLRAAKVVIGKGCPQATGLTLLEQDFESALAAIPSGYGEGVYKGLRYGVTVRKSRDGKRTSLFARALAGGDVVSFNLYRLRSGEDSLRPCEMPAEKAVAFVLGYEPRP